MWPTLQYYFSSIFYLFFEKYFIIEWADWWQEFNSLHVWKLCFMPVLPYCSGINFPAFLSHFYKFLAAAEHIFRLAAADVVGAHACFLLLSTTSSTQKWSQCNSSNAFLSSIITTIYQKPNRHRHRSVKMVIGTRCKQYLQFFGTRFWWSNELSAYFETFFFY